MRTVRWASLFVAVALLAGQARAETVVKIGAALSMTGPAAAYGAQQKAGILAAVEQINKSGALKGVKLEAVVEDDGSTKEQGIAVFQRFINKDKVVAIIGPTLSNTAYATNPLAQAAGVPVVAISNTAPKGITDVGEWIWRVSLTEAQVIPGALKAAQAKLGFKSAGVLYGNDDAFTQGGYAVMKDALAAMGVKTVGTQTFAKPDRDYNAQLTQLLAQKPEILVVSALVENASGIVAQARQLGYQGPILGGNGFNSPKLIENAGKAAEGVLVGTAWNKVSADKGNQDFLALMAAKNHAPDQFCTQAYVGVEVIAEAIRLSGKPTREGVKAGFLQLKGLATPLGKFSFQPSRDGDHAPAVQVVKDGKFQIMQ